ncbi:HlyD family type I secretion periplasmic adaptor subunit [Frigidibacter albus]|uniref:Membrane fusion protein (MFP) family protein n=1 Tax=Frigidibacter albus TaxID=1465486 RepID=A0A6L8VC41_9RHOB|nr:HlyD family type I secretion periplasmic adaptor subunit [Frigidibacter albus]MZQ87898.1 HlyD family type I secretion periplasmic adaptor subunit [Frigidibacter albus]NBE29804.1 HlyD family type I secretion periplasmic adaptor subunit [Frigidibacter albus]GGH42664.1 HlyD family type I secretion periplasmic adaptor subunit [Frigidibacter albus]
MRRDDPALAVRGPALAGALVLVLLAAGLAAWSALAPLSGAIIAPGRVEVQQRAQVVQHPDGGVVAEILVAEGDRVAAGTVLIRLDGAALRSELAIVEALYVEHLARRGRLEAERVGAAKLAMPAELAPLSRADFTALIDGQTRFFAARAETAAAEAALLDRRASQIAARSEGIAAERAALLRQQALIAEELAGQRSLLDRGLAQSARVLALEREAARLDGRAGELAAAAAEAEARHSETLIEALRLQASRREEAEAGLRDLAASEMELAERRGALLLRLGQLDLRAPAAGIVHALQVTTPRAVIRPAEPVLHLVPQDRPLLVALRIPAGKIGHVQPGQTVSLRLPGPGAGIGQNPTGQIARISPDALQDSAETPAFFRAEVEVTAGPGTEALTPGLPVEGFIATRPQPPLALLLGPLTRYFARAFPAG